MPRIIHILQKELRMKKQLFLDFISKYTLGGLIETVAWESKHGKLSARMISDHKNLVGEINYNNFDIKDFEGKKLGIFKTSRLVGMLNVCLDDIEASLEMIGDNPVKISITDERNVKVRYALSDLVVIPSVPSIKQVPTHFDVVATVDSDFVNLYSKAKSALPEVENFTVQSTDTQASITLGQTDTNDNVISMNFKTSSTKSVDAMQFPADLFRQVLLANKGVEGTFKVSSQGLATIEYITDEYTAKYYLVAKK